MASTVYDGRETQWSKLASEWVAGMYVCMYVWDGDWEWAASDVSTADWTHVHTYVPFGSSVFLGSRINSMPCVRTFDKA